MKFISDSFALEFFPKHIELMKDKGYRLHSWSVFAREQPSNGPVYFHEIKPFVAALYKLEANSPKDGAEPAQSGSKEK